MIRFGVASRFFKDRYEPAEYVVSDKRGRKYEYRGQNPLLAEYVPMEVNEAARGFGDKLPANYDVESHEKDL